MAAVAGIFHPFILLAIFCKVKAKNISCEAPFECVNTEVECGIGRGLSVDLGRLNVEDLGEGSKH